MIPEEFLALWDDGLLAKFELSPLSRPGVHELCEQVLRADVSPWVSAVFSQVADGNPLMLMSLIEYARTSGALVLRNGVWFLRAKPDLAGVPAADVIDQQLRSMTPEERIVATIVSLAGPLSLGQILRFSSPKAVDALEAAGIITVSPGHDRTVRPASMLLGEIIRRRAPAGQSAALRESLLALPSAGPVLPETFQNQLRWSLDCGAAVPPEQLLQAAEARNTDLDPTAAVQAASAIKDAQFLPEAKIQLAYAHYILGRPDDAESCLRAALPLPYGRPWYLAARLGALLPGGVAAPPGGATGTASAPGPDVTMNGSLWAQSPAASLAAGILHRNWEGPSSELDAGLQELIDAADRNPDLRLPAVSLLAELRAAQGLLLTGLQVDRDAWAGIRGTGQALPLAQEQLLARHCLSLIRAGEWGELAGALDDYAAASPPACSTAAGCCMRCAGSPCCARDGFRKAWRSCSSAWKNSSSPIPWKCCPSPTPSPAMPPPWPDIRGRRRNMRGRFPFRRLSRAARACSCSSEAYCLAVERLTGREVAGGAWQSWPIWRSTRDSGALRQTSGGLSSGAATPARPGPGASSGAVEGSEARLLEALRSPCPPAMPAGLIAISDEAAAAGQGLLALDAAQQAAACLENSPDRWRAHRCPAQAPPPDGRCRHIRADGPCPQRAKVPVLTARETEILEFVAAGSTNADIAAALSLSPRTVEGHLSRIFAKLGVSRRSELLMRSRKAAPRGCPGGRP